METAIAEIESVDDTQTNEMEEPPPVIEKAMAKKWIQSTVFPTCYGCLH